MSGPGDVQTQTVRPGDQRRGAVSPPPSQVAPGEGVGKEQTRRAGGKTVLTHLLQAPPAGMRVSLCCRHKGFRFYICLTVV